jgi:hypothetical protein
MKSAPSPPMTLGNAAAARVRLIVWCKACGHRVEPDAAEMAGRYGADTAVPRVARAARLLPVRPTWWWPGQSGGSVNSPALSRSPS